MTRSWLDADICIFHGTTNPTPIKTVTIATALDAIATGAYRDPIERLRHLRATKNEEVYKAAKSKLDALTFGGTFHPTRAKSTLVRHSGMVLGDIDHVADVDTVRRALCGDAYTAYCFTSPGGDGVKLGVQVPPVLDDEAYKHAWETIATYYQQQYGVPWDTSGKDVSRLCFASWDPTLYRNPAAMLFDVPPKPEPAITTPHTPPPSHPIPNDRRDFYARQAIDTATRMLDTSTPGNRHHMRTKAGYLLGGYVGGGILSYDDAYAALEVAVDRNSAHPLRSVQTIADCLQAGMAAAISLEDLEQQRRDWPNSANTSFTSVRS
jgi:BT4734-like, N-terminal domain